MDEVSSPTQVQRQLHLSSPRVLNPNLPSASTITSAWTSSNTHPEHQGASRSASPVALDQRPVPAATMGAWNVRGDPRRDGTHANRHRSSASWATCPTPCRNASSSLPSTATALPRASRSSRRACTRSCFARATSTSSGSTRCGTCSSRSFTSLAPFTYSASCNGCTRGRARGSCRGRWGAASWACRCSCRRL